MNEEEILQTNVTHTENIRTAWLQLKYLVETAEASCESSDVFIKATMII